MISAGELAEMRRDVDSTFVHTYTRTPRAAGADDAWGDQSFSDATPLTGRPCKYREASTPLVGPNGLEVVNIPQMQVPALDPITMGDKVSQIKDAYGNVMVQGPVEVEDVSPVGTIAGGPLHLQVRLRQVQNV